MTRNRSPDRGRLVLPSALTPSTDAHSLAFFADAIPPCENPGVLLQTDPPRNASIDATTTPARGRESRRDASAPEHDALVEHALQDIEERAVVTRCASVDRYTALPASQNSPSPMLGGRARYLPGAESLPVLDGSAGLWQDAVTRHLTELHEVLKDLPAPEL